MLEIEAINHVGVRVRDKTISVRFYETLGFVSKGDLGFEKGHPIVMRHPCGVVLNLLGPAHIDSNENILMDIETKHTGITHIALTVSSLAHTTDFLNQHNISITGSFSFGNMSAVFIRDPDRNVIELDSYNFNVLDDNSTDHP